MNYEKLRAAVSRSGMKQGFLAVKIGISDSTMHDKLNGTSAWKVTEAAAFSEALGLSRKQRDEIFFGDK